MIPKLIMQAVTHRSDLSFVEGAKPPVLKPITKVRPSQPIRKPIRKFYFFLEGMDTPLVFSTYLSPIRSLMCHYDPIRADLNLSGKN